MEARLLALSLGLSLAGGAGDSLLGFDGAIGVTPVPGVTGSGDPALNVVRTIQPAGAPWRISTTRSRRLLLRPAAGRCS